MMVLLANKKERIYEGVKLHCGLAFAVTANKRFDDLYQAKHSTCLDHILSNSSNFDAGREYAQREVAVYERYMMMRVHEYDKRFKPQSAYVFEGGVRE